MLATTGDSGCFRCESSLDDTDTVVVALGSVLGTIKDTVDELRGDGFGVSRPGGSSGR